MKIRLHALIVTAALALGACATTPVPSTAAASDSALQAPRLIALEAAQNFRDIGGYRTADGRRVKWGAIYRSADLSRLSKSDLETVGGLGIQTVFDLRSTSERRTAPDAFSGRSPTVSVDYDTNAQAIAAAMRSKPSPEALRTAIAVTYPELLQTLQPEYRQMFDALLEGKGATLYHCTAGKDRTGMATALILSALNVPRETIYADYLMSNRYYRPVQSATPMAGLPPELFKALMGVDESYLRAAFDAIEKQHGSVDDYLERVLGVDAAKRRRLRALYTE